MLIPPPELTEDLGPVESGISQVMASPVPFIDPDEDQPAVQRVATEVNQAFGVTSFFWKDLELKPFSISREADWMRHRELLGDAPLKEVISLPFAVLPDALRVLWFCAVDPQEWLSIPGMVQEDIEEKMVWRRLTGQEKAFLVEAKIREWADQHVTRAEGPLAVTLFYDIYNSSQGTRAVAKPGEHHSETKEKN